MAANAKPKGKQAKDRKAAAPPPDARPRLSCHPKASRQIREAKAWSGIAGFVLVLFLSLDGGALPFDAGVRALIAGAGCYVAGWAVAVLVWTQLARAEVLAAERRYQESLEER